ncbi:hypothetical protein BFL35_14355 [Clavibacter michiganensis]|nr:hypothetical protein BFL35_14355 [Clavibacter michiganensis]
MRGAPSATAASAPSSWAATSPDGARTATGEERKRLPLIATDAPESSASPTTVSGASGAAVTGRSTSGAGSSAVHAPRPTTTPAAAIRATEARRDRGRRSGEDTGPRYGTSADGGRIG